MRRVVWVPLLSAVLVSMSLWVLWVSMLQAVLVYMSLWAVPFSLLPFVAAASLLLIPMLQLSSGLCALCGAPVLLSKPPMRQSVVLGTVTSGAPVLHSSNSRAQAGNLVTGVSSGRGIEVQSGGFPPLVFLHAHPPGTPTKTSEEKVPNIPQQRSGAENNQKGDLNKIALTKLKIKVHPLQGCIQATTEAGSSRPIQGRGH